MKREDLGDLMNLLVIAEEGSFTRAATRLGISQSALSQAMRRLEGRLGIRLLNRTTRSVAPTEAGDRLIETLRPALDEVSEKLAAVTSMRERIGGTIRILTPERAARTVLWPTISAIVTEYPDINIELILSGRLTDIVGERCDAGVRIGEELVKDMIALPIGPMLRMAAVASSDYLAKRGIPKTPHDLASHACVAYRRSESSSVYAWEFGKDGKKVKTRPHGQLIFNDSELLIAAALNGHGIAFVLESSAVPYLDDGSLIRVLEDWSEPFPGFHLYYPSRRQNSAAFALFVERVRYREANLQPG
ncbi:LysR family transcriptional regulator [Cupriavidus sp. CuC1]|uniref:LysR family transcriptional regulator n=1 Tax=Cupriavidus sp. CuC1 TaxID=3373131 RepID=UPI0037D123AC